MKFGASTFFNNFENLINIVDSIEYYIPKLNIYNKRMLINTKLNKLLDMKCTYNIECTMHAPYYNNSYSQYPQDLIIDLTNMNKKDKLFMKEIIELAVRFDSNLLVIHPGRIHNNNKKKSLEKMNNNFKDLVNFASDCDILIGLENKESTDNLNLGTNVKDLLYIIESINSENLGLVFDIGHANLTCGGDQKKLEEYYLNIKDHIIHTHIHDNLGISHNNFYGDSHLCPGLGNINYNILKNIIDEDIIFNFELYSEEDIINGKKYILTQLNKIAINKNE